MVIESDQPVSGREMRSGCRVGRAGEEEGTAKEPGEIFMGVMDAQCNCEPLDI